MGIELTTGDILGNFGSRKDANARHQENSLLTINFRARWQEIGGLVGVNDGLLNTLRWTEDQ